MKPNNSEPTGGQMQQIDTCHSCAKEVKENDASVQCDGVCEGWFHKECTGMTVGEFDILKRKQCKLLWLCTQCKYEVTKRKGRTDTTQLENLTKKVDTITRVHEERIRQPNIGKSKTSMSQGQHQRTKKHGYKIKTSDGKKR